MLYDIPTFGINLLCWDTLYHSNVIVPTIYIQFFLLYGDGRTSIQWRWYLYLKIGVALWSGLWPQPKALRAQRLRLMQFKQEWTFWTCKIYHEILSFCSFNPASVFSFQSNNLQWFHCLFTPEQSNENHNFTQRFILYQAIHSYNFCHKLDKRLSNQSDCVPRWASIKYRIKCIRAQDYWLENGAPCPFGDPVFSRNPVVPPEVYISNLSERQPLK